jgi:Holliday junction resolvase
MPNPSKRKGSGYELEIVKAFQAAGIAAVKVPLSGAVHDGRHDADVIFPCGGVIEWKGECKRRGGEGFKTLYGWLDGNHVLFHRGDRSETLVTMKFSRFLELVKLAEANK